jgi:peptidyl-dipeptidase A
MNAPAYLVLSLLAASVASASPGALPSEAKTFVDQVNRDLRELTIRANTAQWIHETYITDDTERNEAAANDDFLKFMSQATVKADHFRGLKLDPTTDRMIYLLRTASQLPAPRNPAHRKELTELSSKLSSMYGTAKACGPEGKPPCRDMLELEKVLDESRDPKALLDAWTAWHNTARPMRPLYTRMMALANEGARDMGYHDLGDYWRAGYDTDSASFEKQMNQLWTQVRPFYESLHCYVRSKLAAHYGPGVMKDEGPIPAHLLGNMWAQEWGNIYPLVEPYPGQGKLDLTQALVEKKVGAKEIVKRAEAFYTSMGLDPLPASFWERSQFVKPEGRDVVCHASAWDVTLENDLRLKVCFKPSEEDFTTAHHELGHLYYYHAFDGLPILYQRGADNEGFNEAIGDAITLSITPKYLHDTGLMPAAQPSKEYLIDVQLKRALDRVSFLPFGKLIDQWRWDVASGKVTPANYNASWWALRAQYQGITPPAPRGEEDFDPGAKYHIAANVPYVRYFIARIVQFQIHQALCKAAGFKGPLHECSVFGSHEAGSRLNALLKVGASKPWPDALEALAGTRTLDGSALLEYFAPLRQWLDEQNHGKKCGW